MHGQAAPETVLTYGNHANTLHKPPVKANQTQSKILLQPTANSENCFS